MTHRTHYTAVVAATAALVGAIETYQAEGAALPPDAEPVPALPAELDALGDPLGPVADWLCVDYSHARDGEGA